MNRNRMMKNISYTLAAGIMTGAAAISGTAAPLAGASAVLSTAKVTGDSEDEAADTQTYSTVAGVNLAIAKMVASAKNDASNTSASDTTLVAADDTADTDAAAADTDTAADTAADAEAAAPAEEAAAPSEFANIAVSQVSDYVNVRAQASEDSEIVGKLYNNCAATVNATEGDWYQITSGNCTGYVKSQYVVVGDEGLARSVGRRLANVNTETLYVRSAPSTDASVIGMVPGGDDLLVTDESTIDQGWVKVTFEDTEGYVSAQYVSLSTQYNYAETIQEEQARLAAEEAERKAAAEAAAKAEAAKAAAKQKKSSKKSGSSSSKSSGRSYSAPSGGSGSSVVAYASQFIGNPYVYGGTSLTNGTDCSGFVKSVYGAFGVSLPHSSSADRSVGYGVSASDMQPGDIVCYSGHVAIYAGNGQIVHASNRKDGIKVSNVHSSGKILAVRRIF